MANEVIEEYRGVRSLVYAKVTADTADAFTTGEVKPLAGVAEISKSTETSDEAHYYDNQPAIVVSSTGPDEITITTSAIPLDVYADITGQEYDEANGALIEGDRMPTSYAVGYVTQTTAGTDMYVWRFKGTFSIPDSTHATKNDGTDANGQELTFTGIQTTHKFTKTGKGAKGITVNSAVGKVTEADFFAKVFTPDDLTA